MRKTSRAMSASAAPVEYVAQFTSGSTLGLAMAVLLWAIWIVRF